ncbi:MAG: hypothetical protein KKH32_13035 [Bacteroidetes bacterium]|nr:hypothetical protein [Bacteroidota bacterium]
MKYFILLVFFFIRTDILYPQTQLRDSADHIYSFAKHLYCTSDFIRAESELQRLMTLNYSPQNEDTIDYLLGKSLQGLEKFEKSDEYFSKFYDSKSSLKSVAIKEYIKNQFLQQNDFYFYKLFSNSENYDWLEYYYTLKLTVKLRSINDSEIEKDFGNVKNISTQLFIAEHTAKMRSLKSKDPVIAGIMSGVIPGSGKFYTEKYSDGVISFLLTGLFGFLAYDNFSAGHNFRGWLFAGIGSFFYAGNIYGSIISANLFNREQKEKFQNELYHGLSKNNYFIDEVNICP